MQSSKVLNKCDLNTAETALYSSYGRHNATSASFPTDSLAMLTETNSSFQPLVNASMPHAASISQLLPRFLLFHCFLQD